MKTGYVHLYTGNGKGKTTAALGLALRAAGAGKKVFIAQFAKGRHSSEHAALARLKDLITFRLYGLKTFVGKTLSVKERQAAGKGLADASEAMSGGRYDMVILDEAAYAASVGLVSTSRILEAVAGRKGSVEVVITGRNAPRALSEAADLITEMKMKKHYYTAGIKARKGIEF
jgi:cob(I)alamin adenosyltransferase